MMDKNELAISKANALIELMQTYPEIAVLFGITVAAFGIGTVIIYGPKALRKLRYI